MNLEELQELSRRLDALVKDPQPRLLTWREALGAVMAELVEGWTGKKP